MCINWQYSTNMSSFITEWFVSTENSVAANTSQHNVLSRDTLSDWQTTPASLSIITTWCHVILWATETMPASCLIITTWCHATLWATERQRRPAAWSSQRDVTWHSKRPRDNAGQLLDHHNVMSRDTLEQPRDVTLWATETMLASCSIITTWCHVTLLSNQETWHSERPRQCWPAARSSQRDVTWHSERPRQRRPAARSSQRDVTWHSEQLTDNTGQPLDHHNVMSRDTLSNWQTTPTSRSIITTWCHVTLLCSNMTKWLQHILFKQQEHRNKLHYKSAHRL